MVTYLFAQVYNQQEGVTVHRLQKEKATQAGRQIGRQRKKKTY